MEIKKEAIFAGTFDPFTRGHLEVVRKALKVFKAVTILIAINEEKKPAYSLNERIKFIKLSTKGIKGVKIDYTSGLVVNYAKKHNINFLIRGVRNEKDYQYEEKMSEVNKKLNPNILTMVFNVSKRYQNISSSKVRELRKKGEDVSPYVSANIIKYL